ncbi:hypothetical protein G9P44_004113 [Scheffersomyces stipitis]|nr:hypothetical protein G9P44_004113 [Scheffersomyces stipitis]
MVSLTTPSIRNSFISTIDHLPCDVIRSLWFVQNCNISINKEKARLDALLNQIIDARNEESLQREIMGQIAMIKANISRLDLESIQELRALNNQLTIHKLGLVDELEQLQKISESRMNRANGNEGSKPDLRKQLKDHYKSHPLISQREAQKEQDELRAYEAKHKQKSTSGPTGLKLVLKIPHSNNKDRISLKKLSKNGKVEKRLSKVSRPVGRPRLNPVGRPRLNPVGRPRINPVGRPRIHPIGKSAVRPVGRPPKFTGSVGKPVGRPLGSGRPVGRPPKSAIAPVEKPLKSERFADKKKSKNQTVETEVQIDSQQEEDTNKYCFCKQGSFGDMIACDNEESCPNGEWFHYKCVGLLSRVESLKYSTGKQKWFCSDHCREVVSAKDSQKKKKKKRRW